jgi:hypothetical protein
MRSKNEVLCAAAGRLAAERSEADKPAKAHNSYLRYKCKKLSFIARTGLKYDRGTREYFKRCECNKGTFYTYVLQHFIYDREIITPVST